EWGAQVTPENAWREYPRPALKREQWTNLNGLWDYSITSQDADAPDEWSGKILVPFAIESRLSGQQKLLDADEALWYRSTFDCDVQTGNRVLLNFEAVDYRCRVYVNGQDVGGHVGGNTPFTLDITEAAKNGDNEI